MYKNIDIRHHFLRDMVEDKNIYIQYIWSEDNPMDIMKKNTSEEDFARHIKIITAGGIWELVHTGMENVKNTRVMNDIINHSKTEY